MAKWGAAPHLGGDAHVVLGRRGTPTERFMCKVVHSDDGCWLWLGSRNHRGYGLFMDESRRTRRAHRWAYSHFRGAIPDGMTIDHLCAVKHCVNPDHMEIVTRAENHLRWLESSNA